MYTSAAAIIYGGLTDCESGPVAVWPSLAPCEGGTAQSGAGIGPLEVAL